MTFVITRPILSAYDKKKIKRLVHYQLGKTFNVAVDSKVIL